MSGGGGVNHAERGRGLAETFLGSETGPWGRKTPPCEGLRLPICAGTRRPSPQKQGQKQEPSHGMHK